MSVAASFSAAPVDLALHEMGQYCEPVIELELTFKSHLDASLLARSIELLFEAEPILGCRLLVDSNNPRWEVVPRVGRTPLITVSSLEEYESIQRSGLDATANVQVVVCLWRQPHGDRLLVKMTHQVGD